MSADGSVVVVGPHGPIVVESRVPTRPDPVEPDRPRNEPRDPSDPCAAERNAAEAARRELHSAIRDGASDRAIAHLQGSLNEAQTAFDQCEAANTPPLFVRFQFKSTTFAELVRDQIARSDVGCIEPTASGFVVERIEFPPASSVPMDVDQSGDVVVEASAPGATIASPGPTRPDRPGTTLPSPYETITVPVAAGGQIEVRRRRLLLTLPLTIHVRAVDQLGDDEALPLVVTVDVRLRVDLVHRDDGDFVRVAYDSIGHREGNNPGIEQLIREELSDVVGEARESEFAYTDSVFAALESLGAAAAPRVVWSGMTLSPDRKTVEMRVELTLTNHTGTTDPEAWTDFLGRQVDDFRTDHDWAVEIGRDLLEMSATTAAREQVADQDGFDLASGPHVEWRPDLPGFRTSLTGEIIDACNCLGFDIDVNASVEVTTTLDLAQSGPVATIELVEVTRGEATHAGEEACCAITGALLFPILGWKYLGEGKIDWGGFAAGLTAWPVSGLVVMMYLFNGEPPQPPLAEDCRREGDDTKVCAYKFSLNGDEEDPCNPAAVTIFLDQLRGRNSGLVLAGAINEARLEMPQVSASDPTPFEWRGPQPICFAHDEDPLPGPPEQLRNPFGTVGEWSARSTFEVRQAGDGFPLQICGAFAVGPANAIYKPRIVRTTSCPTTAFVEVNTVAWTPGNPEPQPLVVVTNVGAKLVMLPPLPPVTEEDEQTHREFVAWFHRVKCGIPERGKLTSDGQVDATWVVDPPADGGEMRRLWVIRAGGLQPGEQLVVSDGSSGAKLAIAEPRSKRGVRLDLLHDGDRLQVMRRLANGEPSVASEDTKVAISQILLEQVDARTLHRPAQALAPADDGSRRAIEVITGGDRHLVHLGPAGAMVDGRRRRWSAVRRAKPWRRTPARVGVAGGDVSHVLRYAVADLRSGGGREPSSADVASTANRWRWIVDKGPEGFVEVDARAGRGTNRYRYRPWVDGMVHVGGIIVRLDDDRATLRTYRVVDSLTL